MCENWSKMIEQIQNEMQSGDVLWLVLGNWLGWMGQAISEVYGRKETKVAELLHTSMWPVTLH